MPREAREVPWLSQVGKVYYVNWYDAEARRTKRLSLATSEAKQAQARYALFLTDGAAAFDTARPERPAGLTVSAALDDYWREHLALNAVAKERAEDAIDVLKLFFSDRPVTEIDIPLCRAYAAARASAAVAKTYRDGVTKIPAGPATIRRELGVLSAALAHAVKWKRLAVAPFVEKPTVQTGQATWLYHDELERLRAAADGRTRDFIELAYWTAARRGSVERLTVFQVDLDQAILTTSHEGDRETVKRRGVVPIDDALLPTVRRLVAEATNGYLLGSAQPIYRGFIAACKAAGVYELPARGLRRADTLSPHSLRHSRATHLLQAGTDPYAVAGLLHDSVATVMATYGHHCPEHVRRALRGYAEPERNAQSGAESVVLRPTNIAQNGRKC